MESMMVKSPPRTLMEVFKSLPEGTRVQLIENNLIMTPASFVNHQRIHREIFSSLLGFLKTNPIGEIFGAPLDVYLDSKNALQPDIMFISNRNRGIIRDDGLHGAPDLVIEILSKSTAKYDLHEKRKVYERSGVLEYWIVDPETKNASGYFLKDHSYGEALALTGIIRSQLLNYEIRF